MILILIVTTQALTKTMSHILATSLALDNDGSEGSDASEETTLAISEGTPCATQQRGGDSRVDIFKRSFDVFLHESETETAASALTIARLEEDNAVQVETIATQAETIARLEEDNDRLEACVEDTAKYEKRAQLKRKQDKEKYEEIAMAEVIKQEAELAEATEENILLKKELAESTEKTTLLEEENAKLKRFKDGWFDVISMFQAKYPCTNLVLLAIQVSPSS